MNDFITPPKLAARLRAFKERPATGTASTQNDLHCGLLAASTWNDAARAKLRDMLDDLERAVLWGVVMSLSPEQRAALRPLADTMRGDATDREMQERIFPFFIQARIESARRAFR